MFSQNNYTPTSLDSKFKMPISQKGEDLFHLGKRIKDMNSIKISSSNDSYGQQTMYRLVNAKSSQQVREKMGKHFEGEVAGDHKAIINSSRQQKQERTVT